MHLGGGSLGHPAPQISAARRPNTPSELRIAGNSSRYAPMWLRLSPRTIGEPGELRDEPAVARVDLVERAAGRDCPRRMRDPLSARREVWCIACRDEREHRRADGAGIRV